MVSAWYMKANVSNQKLENATDPPKSISLEDLEKNTGVIYKKLDPKNYEKEISQIKEDGGYSFSDIVDVSPEKLPNYDETLKNFFEEHIHTDEEIRFIIDGSGYFDVRDNNDVWIRILVEAGDLIILPSGIYHRFTLDTKDYVKAMRLFAGVPVWTPHRRPADDMPARKQYLDKQRIRLTSA